MNLKSSCRWHRSASMRIVTCLGVCLALGLARMASAADDLDVLLSEPEAEGAKPAEGPKPEAGAEPAEVPDEGPGRTEEVVEEVVKVREAVSPEPSPPLAIEEIVVTAQKRAEAIYDVPISVSAMDAVTVEKTGVDTIDSIVSMTPGLNGSTYGIATPAWGIRGISSNDFTIGSEPSVAVFVDDAYIGRNVAATAAFFDVERVEVVKGPQGTLFGRNSSTGAISIVTNKPDPDDRSVHLGGSFGNEGQRDYDAVGNFGMGGIAGIRLAVHGTSLSGIQTIVNQGEDLFENRDSGRLSLSLNPTESVSLLGAVSVSKAGTNHNGFYNPDLQPDSPPYQPGEEFPDRYALTDKERENARNLGGNFRLIWDIAESWSLTSISDVRGYDYDHLADVDGTGTPEGDAKTDAALAGLLGIPAGSITGGMTVSFENPDTRQRNVSQELRLNYTQERFNGFLGASFFDEEVDEITVLDFRDTNLGVGSIGTDRFVTSGDNRSFGVYGDVTASFFGEVFAVTVGGRYSKDNKDWCTDGVAGLGVIGPGTNGPLCGSESWADLSGRFVAEYYLNPDVLTYVSVAQGYKGGGFNTAPADLDGDGVGDEVASFDPERNLAYEVGIKGGVLDNRARFAAAAFRNNYEDLQFLTTTIGGLLIDNAAKARTAGLEVEGRYLLVADLEVSANYAFLDASTTAGEFEGNTLALAPKHSGSVALDYSFQSLGGSLNVFSAYNWSDDYFFDLQNDLSQGAYGTWDLRVAYSLSDRFAEGSDLYVGVTNLLDRDYANFKQDLGLGTSINRGNPRLMFAGVNLRF